MPKRSPLLPIAAALLLMYLPSAPAVGAGETAAGLPRGEVFSPQALFQKLNEVDPVVLESNARLFLFSDFDPQADKILVIGLPGWGGRSENFIGCLQHSLGQDGLSPRLVLAAIQDPVTRGPRYQGQGAREHANVWRLNPAAIQVLQRLIIRLADELGHLRVYFLGFSTGSVAAPLAALKIAQLGQDQRYTIEGAILLGTGSNLQAYQLKAHNQRALILTVPPKLAGDKPALRYDQGNRSNAELTYALLQKGGATAYLRHIASAKRHIDWHWGLMSQCRYFPRKRIDDGRGYWPFYWKPNPETFHHVRRFIRGKPPLDQLAPLPYSSCPHDPPPGEKRRSTAAPARQQGTAP